MPFRATHTQTPASQPGDYERILAVKLADLGDLLTVTPALQALREAYPAAQIELLVPPSSEALLRHSPYINKVLTFDKFPFDRKRGLLSASRLWQTALFMLQLRLTRYDAILLFHHFATRWGTFKFAAVAYASGARVRAGLDNGRGFFLNLRLPDRGFGVMHEVDYWLSLASLLGAKRNHYRPHIAIDPRSRASALDLLADVGINRATHTVAIHPGAGWYSRARIWPAENFAAVARGLIESHGANIVVLGGPDETEAAARIEEIAGHSGKVVNLVGRTSILETAAVIQQCDLFVGNDSGPMHIAAAVGTPVVAVFGPSNVQAWGPYTPPGEPSMHRVVSRDLPCMPCFYRGHSLGLREGCGTRECLTLLSHKPVLSACRDLLGHAPMDREIETEEVLSGEP